MLTLALWLAGCSRVELAASVDLSTEGVTRAELAVERGDVAWKGEARDGIEGEVVSWGAGASRGQAARREAGNVWTAEVEAEAAVFNASSAFAGAGMDVDLRAPAGLLLDVWVKRGGLVVRDVSGLARLEAERVEASELSGDVAVVATLLGADLTLRPATECAVTVDAVGATVLRLPRTGAYDLAVEADPDAPMDIEDIGFDVLTVDPGLVTARREPGTCRVRVTVRSGGSFALEAAPPPPTTGVARAARAW